MLLTPSWPLACVRSRRGRGLPHVEASSSGQSPPPAADETDAVDDATLDRLSGVFRARPREQWRRLLAASTEWPRLSSRVLARLAAQAATASGTEELELLKLRRQLLETSNEVDAFRACFKDFLDTPMEEWEARHIRRATLSLAFFEYLQVRISALETEVDEREGAFSAVSKGREGTLSMSTSSEIASAAARLISLVDMHDMASKDALQMDESFRAFQELLAGATSVQEIDNRVDALLAAGKVDPALVLTASKMYMSVKESSYTSEEVKDVMAHLYWRMKSTVAEQQPPAVRILKHLLSMEDPLERLAAMDKAFTPGPELTSGGDDFLSTTPGELLKVIAGVLQAYEAQRGRATMQGQAVGLMQPAVIERMRALQGDVQERYM